MNNQVKKEKQAVVVGTVGGIAGVGASVGAVSAAGTVSGLGAAGVTSGLAAIGGMVGGGMVAGLAVTAAAPLAIGGCTYGLYKWLVD